MAEHIGNGFERMALLEHARGKAMAKGMRAFARNFNVRFAQTALNNG